MAAVDHERTPGTGALQHLRGLGWPAPPRLGVAAGVHVPRRVGRTPRAHRGVGRQRAPAPCGRAPRGGGGRAGGGPAVPGPFVRLPDRSRRRPSLQGGRPVRGGGGRRGGVHSRSRPARALADLPSAGLRLPLLAAARAAGELLGDPARFLVRACPGAGCAWLLLDESGRRRWCSLRTCGGDGESPHGL
ncbi:CGNR zinc finger domain-containing protein [Streptomyces sp. 5K101]|uniref:CGNR zinc finger domain-containing protein n=1 Tax=Streptomyces sp. 5K101 TaxID=3390037 RepID=UPI003976A8B7